jgi:hypothetical protein
MHEAIHPQVLPSKGVDNIQYHHNSHQRICGFLQERVVKHPPVDAFGFLAGGYFNLATAMVFGSTASTSSWEPFRHAIQALSVIYAHCPDLIKKHRKFLDMISWVTLDLASDLARAIPCSINTGVLDNQGIKVLLPARIYVDNGLMLAISKENMEQVLAALIKAMFVVMGIPNSLVH